jgi:hypothetical protein
MSQRRLRKASGAGLNVYYSIKTSIFVNHDYPDSLKRKSHNRRIVGWWMGLKIDVHNEYLDNRNVIQE